MNLEDDEHQEYFGILAGQNEDYIHAAIEAFGAFTNDNPVRPEGTTGFYGEYKNGQIVVQGETILLEDGQFDHIIREYEP